MFLKSRFVKGHSSLLKFSMSCKTARCAKTSKTQFLVHLEIHCCQQTFIKPVCINKYNCKYCIFSALFNIQSQQENKQTHLTHMLGIEAEKKFLHTVIAFKNIIKLLKVLECGWF